MTKYEIGTLKDIGAQVGDVVEWSGCQPPRQYTIGLISEWNYYEGDDHDCPLSGLPWWRIISRSKEGPVREVTTVRKEIVPGVYGAVEVGSWSGPDNMVCLGIMQDCITGVGKEKVLVVMGVDTLTAAITTLTQIRDAMADSCAT